MLVSGDVKGCVEDKFWQSKVSLLMYLQLLQIPTLLRTIDQT